ncbi:prepilin peptidase [bacterium]|nr:prepilin peptidase [bacterium]
MPLTQPPIPSSFFDPFYAPIQLPFIFIMGAAIGSFLNVCIYRIPLGISLSYPSSHCYRCGQPVRWFDNIPLLSYLVLRGRCRHCGVHFSARYFFIELLTALLALGTALKLGYSLALIQAYVFIGLLIVATFTDIDHWIIPDRITIGGTVAGLLLAVIWPVGMAQGNPLAGSFWLWTFPPHYEPFVNAALGAAGGFLILWAVGWLGTLIFRKEAMGFGDVKLFAMLGSFCGVEYLLHILVISCLIGTVVGLIGMARGALEKTRKVAAAVAPLEPDADLAERLASEYGVSGDERAAIQQALAKPGAVGPVRHHLPFGPSLAVGALIVYFYGPAITRLFDQLVGQ